MNCEIAFEWLHLAEYRLDQCALAHSVFSYDADTISLREDCLTYIK